MNRLWVFCCTAWFCCSLFGGSALATGSMEYQQAERPDFSLGIGFDYETGDYGTGSDSDFISVPFYLDLYPTDRLDFELIVPYVYLRTEDDGGAVVYRTSGGASVVRGRSRGTTSSDSSTETSETTSGGHNSESGLGDITLTAGYVLVEESESTPQIRPTFYLKFPTADEDKGLGTGEFDYGPGVTLSKWQGDWHLFAEGLYVFQGDSSLYETKDYFSYNGGIGRQINDSLYGAVLLQGATAPADGADAALEGRVKGVWQMAPKVALEAYLGAGLSDGSPDFSSSLAVFFDF